MNAALTPLQRAFLALQEETARADALEAEVNAPIAIIGLGCRAPGGVRDAVTFWRLLSEQRDAIGPVPKDRWDHDAIFDPDPEVPGKIAATAAGFCDHVDLFDSAFFGLSPREADGIDPQQRMLLEVCWETLENAGQAPDRLHSSPTGVYVGAAGSDYAYMQMKSGGEQSLDAHFASGIAHSVLSGRISYLLGLQGPSLTIDTACSSSLVAIHLACQSLRARECRLALAGGVNLILSPEIFIALSHARMLALDGRCKAFDAAADGFGRGEGCAMLALKRLADAEADGDRVLAIIRGSAVNQDGPSSSLTAPNGPAQEAVIRAALAKAGITPHLVGYVEAHGTGTQLGDPLEAQALGAVFSEGRPADRPLLIGSVKSNVGHLEAAAGAIGLVKTVLALQHAEVPASLHVKTPSPHVPWRDLGLCVAAQAQPWPEIEGRRIGAVSSFGFSGTNAHIVVEAAPLAQPSRNDGRALIAPLSAHRPESLRELAASHRDALMDAMPLTDVARTLTAGRAHRTHRAVVRTQSIADLRSGFDALARDEQAPGLSTATLTRRDPPRVAFLFTGQGAQYAGLAAGLYANVPAFREAFDACDEILGPLLGGSLRELVIESTDAKALEQTALAQPALFAVEYSLAMFLGSLGVKPVAMLGHSVGEYVAACVAGTLDLPDALRLVAARGALMQSLPAGGAMAAIFAPEPVVAEALAPFSREVSIAAINGPAQTVISGGAAAVASIREALAAKGVKSHPLAVSHAFHSPLVEPILDRLEAEAAKATFKTPRAHIISNVTGRRIEAELFASPRYWRRHAREAVRFADGLGELARMKVDICLELGPHPALGAFAATVFEDGGPRVLPTLRRDADDWVAMLDMVAALFLEGVEIDWRALDPENAGRPVSLPGPAFQRQRHWFHAQASVRGAGSDVGHPLLGTRLWSPLREVVQFEALIEPRTAAFIADHVVRDRIIMPAAGMIEMGLSAGRLANGAPVEIENFVIGESLAFTDDAARVVQTVVRMAGGRAQSFELLSRPAGEGDPQWTLHAQGDFAPVSAPQVVAPVLDGTRAAEVSAHYDDLARRGLSLGPSLRVLQGIQAVDETAAGVIAKPAGGGYTAHPALLDGCLQVIAAALPQNENTTYLPLAIDRIRFARAPGGSATAYAIIRDRRPEVIKADVVLHDENGEIGAMEGVTLRALRVPAAADFYKVAWRETDAASIADWGVSPAELDSALGARLPVLARAHGLDSYHQSFLALESMSVQWIGRMFAELGWRPGAGERTTAAALARRLAIEPRYRGAFARYLDILVEEGLLRSDGEDFIVVSELPATSPSHDALATEPRARLAATCGDDLARILTGRIDPLHRLFPGGSSPLVETLYRDSPEAKAYNQLLAEAVASIVARAPKGRKVRILEVGGGTGGSTCHIAPMLQDASVTYCFTDIGLSMVERARQSFAHYGFMSFRRFDIDGDAAVQGFEPEAFDIIIAANVVHATADLRRTLGQLNGLLVPGGVLFLLEVTGFERWIDLTFGLTEGWWRFTDRDLRQHYPLLDRGAWGALLGSCGFMAGEIGAPLATSREALIVGRKSLAPALRRWAMLGDGTGLAGQVGAQLTALGQDVQSLSESDFDDVVCFSFLDIAGASDASLADQRTAMEPIFAAIRRMGAAKRQQRLWIVTRGAVAAMASDMADPSQATALGIRRAAALEHPDWHPTLIDLDANAATETQVNGLIAELLSPAGEAERALRAGRVFASRLSRLPQPPPGPMRLEASGTGVLDGLRLQPASRRAPKSGEIEIQVSASGLNFRDVMNALAMRADGEPLGGECAGVVSAVGAGVKEFAIGDRVTATGAGAFATYVIVDARATALRPRGLSDAQAAALPLAAMTARHAITELAKLRAGQSILIHAGAGGLGMAAIAMAKGLGARIFATAGSEAKRGLLRDLGVEAVFSSRTLAFEGEIMRITQGRGVDVVLNSLAGDFIGASVRTLGPEGVFLEVGKQDIWTQEQFRAVRPAARYHPIDLARMRLDDPARWGALFQGVIADAASGVIDPPPVRVFPLAQAAEAFAFMAASRHVGKIVLEHPGVAGAGFGDLDPEGFYLITGAFAGLGLATAQRLVERGALRLALLGRSAPGAEAAARIADWRAAGLEVLTLQLDVADRSAMTQAFARIDATGRALRGVVHSAGTLADGTLLQQDWPRFEIPLCAKVAGAWTLHELTRERRLEFFILFSSIAGTFGSAGQANHAAANAFMDALAERRRAEGLPALSIAWGAWSEIGAAATRGVDEKAASWGVHAISPAKGLDALETLAAGAAARVVASPMDWRKYLAQWDGAAPKFFDEIVAESAPAPARATHAAHDGRGKADDAFVGRLQAAPRGARRDMLSDFIALTVARVLGRQGEAIDPHQPLNEMGLDSLLAVELRNRLGTALGIGRGLPATLVFDCPTVEALAEHLDGRLRPAAEEMAEPDTAGTSHDAIAGIDEMSDEEVEAMFDRMAGA